MQPSVSINICIEDDCIKDDCAANMKKVYPPKLNYFLDTNTLQIPLWQIKNLVC